MALPVNRSTEDKLEPRFTQPLAHRTTAETYYAYRLLRTPPSSNRIARLILIILGVFFLMMFLPWQQNIRANGALTALRPQDRPQVVPTQIDGRISQWYVAEGDVVEAGDTLVRIEEIKDKFFDPKLVERLLEQREAKQNVIEANQRKRGALIQQYDALTDAQRFKLEQAENKLQQARYKVLTDSIKLEAERVNYEVAETRYQRQKSLFDQDLKSRTELESAVLKLQEAQAKLNAQENQLAQARNEFQNARIQFSTLRAEYAEKQAKALSERGSAESYIATSAGELAKLENELENVRQRRARYYILAPQAGVVVRANQQGIGQTVKAGDAIVTIQPVVQELAVELYVEAMDVPLLSKDDQVRLQFDGWPALQISGWPSVSVGTFGGKVEVIDRINSVNGKYRVLITPDPTDEPWPAQLRIGSGVYGWAMLREVRLWFEIWRQLNGFPPARNTAPIDDGGSLFAPDLPGGQPGKSTSKDGAKP